MSNTALTAEQIAIVDRGADIMAAAKELYNTYKPSIAAFTLKDAVELAKKAAELEALEDIRTEIDIVSTELSTIYTCLCKSKLMDL